MAKSPLQPKSALSFLFKSFLKPPLLGEDLAAEDDNGDIAKGLMTAEDDVDLECRRDVADLGVAETSSREGLFQVVRMDGILNRLLALASLLASVIILSIGDE